MDSRTAEQRARHLDIPAMLAPAANYELSVEHDGLVHLSGQLPRLGHAVVVTGRVGLDTTLAQARDAAGLCTLRALAVLRQALGSLDRVARVIKLNVFVQCGPDFTQHSEVADAASDLLIEVFGRDARPARTAVGVYQLPKNAVVELDLIVAVHAAAHPLENPKHDAVD
ncbi:RidA family protein [Variovorax arabinosiphilus]|uniref:RidA family protein n=1 Tax=Variovorax arabinosiphilus TaxID=3053498 RepID=UPI002577DE87|nr:MULTISPECIES: RidA family protein [unclassified Variovorax]MDM0123053.1 RidA family protein [Variovorax sp. J2L1-78]MDM0131951.1 RidA family protein [Variovorax sp. J2L1-63]MDM0235816.1 RidA family protein [Variovorax sp. J2R1-6]